MSKTAQTLHYTKSVQADFKALEQDQPIRCDGREDKKSSTHTIDLFRRKELKMNYTVEMFPCSGNSYKNHARPVPRTDKRKIHNRHKVMLSCHVET
jgi:hypothetical protein